MKEILDWLVKEIKKIKNTGIIDKDKVIGQMNGLRSPETLSRVPSTLPAGISPVVTKYPSLSVLWIEWLPVFMRLKL